MPPAAVTAPSRSNRPDWRGRLLEHQGRGQGQDKADRRVDDQRPAPRGVGDEQAADHEADGTGEGRNRGINAGRPAAFRALWEVGDNQGQSSRGGERRTDALRCPRGQEPQFVLRDTPEQRRSREQHQSEDQDPAVAEDVTHPAPEAAGSDQSVRPQPSQWQIT